MFESLEKTYEIIKENKIYFIFVLALCASLIGIFILYTFNPYNILHLLPRIVLITSVSILCILTVGLTIIFNKDKSIRREIAAQIIPILYNLLYLFGAFLAFCVFFYFSKNVLFHSNMKSVLLPLVIVIVLLSIIYSRFIQDKSKKDETFSFDEEDKEPIWKTLLFYIPCLLVNTLDFLVKDINNMPQSTYILMLILLVILLVFYLIPFFQDRERQRAYDGSVLLLKGPKPLEKELLYMNQSQFKEKIIEAKPFFQRVLLQQNKKWEIQMENATEPSLIDQYNQWENKRIFRKSEDGTSFIVNDDVEFKLGTTTYAGKIVSKTTEISGNDIYSIELTYPPLVTEVENRGGVVATGSDTVNDNNRLTMKTNVNKVELKDVLSNMVDNTEQGEVTAISGTSYTITTNKNKEIVLNKADAQLVRKHSGPIVTWADLNIGSNDYILVKDLPMCENKNVICDSSFITCVDYNDPDQKQRVRYRGHYEPCSIDEKGSIFSQLFQQNEGFETQKEPTMYNPEMHRLDHTIMNEDLLSILSSEEESILQNALQNDSSNFSSRLRELSEKADIETLYLEYISNHKNYHTIMSNIHELNKSTNHYIHQETSALIHAINRAHNIHDYNYHYAISFWIYIDSEIVKENNTQPNQHILEYAQTPYIYYNTNQNELVVEVNDCDSRQECKPSIMYRSNQVLYQRWNNIIINFDYGTLDVFINNNLVSTKQNVSPYIKQENNFIQIGSNDKKAKHIAICNVHYYDQPLNLKQIKHIYKNKNEPCK